MENYATLFDAKFLPQGLALHASMMRVLHPYRLWILCMDSECFGILNSLSLPNVILLKVEDYEGPELLGAKAERSAGEYCWTLTPFVAGFVFNVDPSIKRVTYLDADMWFRKSPEPIFLDFEESKKHVLITSHGYAPEYDQSETSGEYCVQFIIFRNTAESNLVRESWEKQCIDWCFSRQEDGKFGDQKYLDAWPIKFPDQVHVMSNFGWALAPWNSIRFPYGEAIFHHFQGFRLGRKGKYFLGHYAVPKPTFEGVYKPYFADIKHAITILEGIGAIIHFQGGDSEINQCQLMKRFAKNLIAFRWRFSPDFSGDL
jgi:hypothetical protein